MLRLIADNTDHHNYLASLLRAITWNTVQAPMPDDLQALILDIDAGCIEEDLTLALRLDLSR